MPLYSTKTRDCFLMKTWRALQMGSGERPAVTLTKCNKVLRARRSSVNSTEMYEASPTEVTFKASSSLLSMQWIHITNLKMSVKSAWEASLPHMKKKKTIANSKVVVKAALRPATKVVTLQYADQSKFWIDVNGEEALLCWINCFYGNTAYHEMNWQWLI